MMHIAPLFSGYTFKEKQRVQTEKKQMGYVYTFTPNDAADQSASQDYKINGNGDIQMRLSELDQGGIPGRFEILWEGQFIPVMGDNTPMKPQLIAERTDIINRLIQSLPKRNRDERSDRDKLILGLARALFHECFGRSPLIVQEFVDKCVTWLKNGQQGPL